MAIWAAYRRRYGSLNLARRIEQSTAHLKANQMMLAGITGVNARDFMPHETPPPKLATDDTMRLMAKR